jgi:hypothetical protein
MPILRRSDCIFTAYGYLSCCDCCDVGELACQVTYSTQCTQLASQLSNITTGQITICSENAVWPPEDGRKDARNVLRNNWFTIKSLIVASRWSHIYSLIKDARSLEHNVGLHLSGLILPFRTPQQQERAPVFNMHLKATQMNIKA